MIRLLDRLVELVLAAAKWLLLPIVTLLVLQWPLRDIVGAYSRETNDLGQWLFALYVAVSITAATRAKIHLAADTLSRHYSLAWRRTLARLGVLLGLIPWSSILLVMSRKIVLASALLFERFSDTYNPGYFIIKLALWLLALLVLIQGIIDAFQPSAAVLTHRSLGGSFRGSERGEESPEPSNRRPSLLGSGLSSLRSDPRNDS
jgi:TRAP-type mannitol/chloroaromatic compound transport system permease small subunit